MTYHVFAIPTGADYSGPGIMLDDAATIEDAIRLVRENGFTVIEEGNGGNFDTYDADDAPRVYGYEPDGHGAFGITVEPPL